MTADPIVLWRTGYQYRDTPPITRVLAVRVTDKTALLETGPGMRNKHQRVMLRSQFEQYHLTWAEAYAFVLDRAMRKVEGARDTLAHAEEQLAAVQSLTPPQEATDV